MSNFKDLLVWQKAHKVAVDAIKMATRIRPTHLSSVKSQVIRAAISVPTNIVEGSGQESPRDFARFLRYSVNSANELEYHLILVHDLDLIGEKEFTSLNDRVEEVQRMLHGLIRSIRKNKAGAHPDVV